MSERERCLFCQNEIATEADWEPFGSECTGVAIDKGRPGDLESALRLADLYKQQRDELLAEIERHRKNAPTRHPAPFSPPLGTDKRKLYAVQSTDRDDKLYEAASSIQQGEGE